MSTRSRSKRPRTRQAPSGAGSRGPLSVRPATFNDIPTLVRHRREMWVDIRDVTRASYARRPPRNAFQRREMAAKLVTDDQLDGADRVYEAWLREEMRARHLVGFLAVSPAGHVAGGGAIWLHPVPPRPNLGNVTRVPYILSMFTERHFRHRGVATRLVQRMIAWARDHDHPWRVTLHASDEGRPLYEKLGFQPSREMYFDLTALGPRRRGRPGRAARTPRARRPSALQVTGTSNRARPAAVRRR